MRSWVTIIIALAVSFGLCNCDSKNNTPINAAPTITSAVYNAAARVLTVVVADQDNDNVTVTVTEPAGLQADVTSRTVAAGAGNAVFTWTASVPATGGAGDTTVTASDGGTTTPATQVVHITVAPVLLSISAVTAADLGHGTATLTVSVVDVGNYDASITVSTPDGMEIDQPMIVVATGNGDAVFTYSATDPAAGASGNVTITVLDTQNRTVSATHAVLIAPVVAPTGPVIGNAAWVDHNDGTGTLSVPVADTASADVTVLVTVPTGVTVDNVTQTVAGGTGTAAFIFTETTAGAGAAGSVLITASEGANQDTADIAIAIAHRTLTIPPIVQADTLYVYPYQSVAAVGEAVDVYVVTGNPAHFMSFLSSVGVTVENGGTYVPHSFNIGAPGGDRLDTDGYWALMGPPFPANGGYLDLGDSLIPGDPVDIGGGLHRYVFAVAPQGTFAPPATWPGGGVMLFNFKLTFAAAGTYHLGFQLNDGTFDETYYSDWSGSYFWGALDNTYTVTVN